MTAGKDKSTFRYIVFRDPFQFGEGERAIEMTTDMLIEGSMIYASAREGLTAKELWAAADMNVKLREAREQGLAYLKLTYSEWTHLKEKAVKEAKFNVTRLSTGKVLGVEEIALFLRDVEQAPSEPPQEESSEKSAPA